MFCKLHNFSCVKWCTMHQNSTGSTHANQKGEEEKSLGLDRLLVLLDDLHYRLRDRAVELFLFLQDVPVGVQGDVDRYRARALKQCLDAVEAVFHSALCNLL